jgi:hypothetical protein
LAGVDLTSAHSKETEEIDVPRLSIHDSVPIRQLLITSDTNQLTIVATLTTAAVYEGRENGEDYNTGND